MIPGYKLGRASYLSPGQRFPRRPGNVRIGGADFDGTNDFMRVLTRPEGYLSGRLWTLSFWYNPDGGDGVSTRIATQASAVGTLADRGMSIQKSATNNFAIRPRDSLGGAAGASIVTGSNTVLAGTGWHHFMGSMNYGAPFSFSAPLFYGYIDGAVPAGLASEALNTTDGAFSLAVVTTIAAGCNAAEKWNGSIADLWWHVGIALDLSMTASGIANQRKFRTATGRPADLGPRGQNVLGLPPHYYHHCRAGDDPNEFRFNRGGNQEFAVTGPVTVPVTSPSD